MDSSKINRHSILRRVVRFTILDKGLEPFNSRVGVLVTRNKVESVVQNTHESIHYFVPKCHGRVLVNVVANTLYLVLGPDVILLTASVVSQCLLKLDSLQCIFGV